MSDWTLRGATLADGTRADLFVSGSHLVDDPVRGAQVIDADGLIALPGLVDPHCHLRQGAASDTSELAETIASGTAAAARGGYTAVAAMPNTSPACNGPTEVAWLAQASQMASSQVVPIGAVTHDRAGVRLADLAGLGRAGVRLFSDDGATVASADLLRQAVLALAPFGGVVADHCQDPALAGTLAWRPSDDSDGPESWPRAAETTIVSRDIQVAKETGRPIHLCHLSCAESVQMVRWAKAHHLPVSAEATPHHLYLTLKHLATGDALFKVNPPLREPEDVEALRAGLADGTIDMIGTDHAPHRGGDKAKHIWVASPGMTGLEQSLAVAIETMVNPGRWTWAQLANAMSHAPARLLRLAKQGHRIEAGAPANLVLVDPTARAIVQPENTASLARNNPYVGLDLPDPVVLTLWAGRLTWSHQPGLPRSSVG